MIISKHIHSCLVIKEGNQILVIDPGNYTYDENGLDINSVSKLNYILITHEHPDHMYIPFIKELIQKFPEVKIKTSNSASKVLAEQGIVTTTEQIEGISIMEVPHEKVFGTTPPENVQFSIFNKITHPGDSLHFQLSTDILALPIQAPWCSLTQAVEYAVSQKPKIVIPIHDWHWNDIAREAFYQRLVKYFSEHGIKFVPLKTGEEYSTD